MTFSEIVSSRRSVRAYKPDPVSETQIETLLDWANQAPSAGNIRPWEFVVLRSEQARRAAVDTTFTGNNREGGSHQEWLMQAPVMIAVCGDLERMAARYGEDRTDNLVALDCSAAVEHILLGVYELGLASCYISGFHAGPLAQALGLPEKMVPVALLPVGYPDELPQERPRRPLAEIVHRERYGE